MREWDVLSANPCYASEQLPVPTSTGFVRLFTPGNVAASSYHPRTRQRKLRQLYVCSTILNAPALWRLWDVLGLRKTSLQPEWSTTSRRPTTSFSQRALFG